MDADFFVHPNAINESTAVGAGTRIWAFAHVMKGAVVGRECNICDHVFIESGAMLGNGVTLKNGVCVWEGVTLENYVFVGPHAMFTNDLYPRSPRNPELASRYSSKWWLVRTTVKEGASLGANATVRCGATVGRYALIAAGAVVTGDVPDHALIVGVPGRAAGWVCMCGARLEDSTLRCPSCDRAYVRAGGGLALEARA